MNRHYDSHFQRDIITIHPGEYYSCKDDVYIATVLGSCISVALFDTEIHLGGINHFMLPSSSRTEVLSEEDEGRFGDYAIELLINDLMKKGAKRKNLRAKIFGGSNVLEGSEVHTNRTGINNINFAINFLELEKISILINDTGGIFPRKIYFHPITTKVFLKRIQPSGITVGEIKKREEAYQNSLKVTAVSAGDITFF